MSQCFDIIDSNGNSFNKCTIKQLEPLLNMFGECKSKKNKGEMIDCIKDNIETLKWFCKRDGYLSCKLFENNTYIHPYLFSSSSSSSSSQHLPDCVLCSVNENIIKYLDFNELSEEQTNQLCEQYEINERHNLVKIMREVHPNKVFYYSEKLLNTQYKFKMVKLNLPPKTSNDIDKLHDATKDKFGIKHKMLLCYYYQIPMDVYFGKSLYYRERTEKSKRKRTNERKEDKPLSLEDLCKNLQSINGLETSEIKIDWKMLKSNFPNLKDVSQIVITANKKDIKDKDFVNYINSFKCNVTLNIPKCGDVSVFGKRVKII